LKETAPDHLYYALYDAQGKLLEQKDILSGRTGIEMKERSNGTYLLSVFRDGQQLKQFRIIKNQ
jgi:hypothetical protein